VGRLVPFCLGREQEDTDPALTGALFVTSVTRIEIDGALPICSRLYWV